MSHYYRATHRIVQTIYLYTFCGDDIDANKNKNWNVISMECGCRHVHQLYKSPFLWAEIERRNHIGLMYFVQNETLYIDNGHGGGSFKYPLLKHSYKFDVFTVYISRAVCLWIDCSTSFPVYRVYRDKSISTAISKANSLFAMILGLFNAPEIVPMHIEWALRCEIAFVHITHLVQLHYPLLLYYFLSLCLSLSFTHSQTLYLFLSFSDSRPYR